MYLNTLSVSAMLWFAEDFTVNPPLTLSVWPLLFILTRTIIVKVEIPLRGHKSPLVLPIGFRSHIIRVCIVAKPPPWRQKNASGSSSHWTSLGAQLNDSLKSRKIVAQLEICLEQSIFKDKEEGDVWGKTPGGLRQLWRSSRIHTLGPFISHFHTSSLHLYLTSIKEKWTPQNVLSAEQIIFFSFSLNPSVLEGCGAGQCRWTDEETSILSSFVACLPLPLWSGGN